MDIDQIKIAHLSNGLRQYESDIIEGRQKLSLTASLLQKINYSLQELEYDHATLSDSSTEQPVKYLQELVHKTQKLTVTQKLKRETWRVDLSRFNNLKYLELTRIPMHLVEGLQALRSQIQVLICERCTDCLEEILGPPDDIWRELRTAKLCYNDFVFLCPFSNTPWLQYLDLSYNRIEDKLSLQTLKNLTYLNLSFNFLSRVPSLSEEVCHKLKVLLINNNYIQDLSAVSVFDNLEELDVANNLLADHSAISPILFLPYLNSINLSNNPISYHPHHRFHTCSYLNKGVNPYEFVLDGQLLTPLEQKEIGRRGETLRHLGIPIQKDLTCLPSGSSPQKSARSSQKKKVHVRDVVIEEGTSEPKVKAPIKIIEKSLEHLETKKQVEELRQRVGENHWLHSHAGSFVQGLMGLQTATGSGVLASTPFSSDQFPPSPKLNSEPYKLEPGDSNRFDSSTSEDYVTALTTQAIIEQIPNHVETSTSENDDHENNELPVPVPPIESENPPRQSELESGFESEEEKSNDEKEEEGKMYLKNYEQSEDESEGQLWLVQRKNDNGDMVGLFLTISEKEIREKCTNTGCTTTKWNFETVESCEKISNNPPTVRLTFNTIRKACRERTFVMEYSDAEILVKKIRSVLEARSLLAMNQVAYRCMKCSSMFSVEIQPTALPILSTFATDITNRKPTVRCPACNSSLVLEMEDAPLPSTDKDRSDNSGTISPASPAIPITHSPSDCSIGSVASLEQRMETEPQIEIAQEGAPSSHRFDSDIEVISNPSQSSIEVLEVQARLQGNLTPNRKRSSEERSVVAAPQLNTVPEVQPNLVGLTESSSSGSLTDSVCTAYESNPVPVRRVGMSDVPEELTPTSNSTYTSLLQGLIQNVTSKYTPTNSPTVDSVTGYKVEYSFTDFSSVDHRIKLFLFQKSFKDDNEEISFLLRGNVVTLSGESTPGCIVVSTHYIYVFCVVAPEIGDEAAQWFRLCGTYRRNELSQIFMLPWQLGVGFHLGTTVNLILLSNPDYSRNFLSFISSNQKKDGLVIQDEPSLKPTQLLAQLVTRNVTIISSLDESDIRHVALCGPVTTIVDNEKVLSLSESTLLVTTTDLLLLQPNYRWLLPYAAIPPESAAHQKLSNIVDISLSELHLHIHYLNEVENQEVWSLGLPSIDSVNLIVESIRGPWEQLFSVSLDLSKNH